MMVAYDNGRLPADALAPIAGGSLRDDCAAAWNAMNLEARDRGCELLPTGSMSSYRSYEQQVYLYELYLSGEGNLAAVPGTSNHGWGTAVDLATYEMRDMIDQIGAKYGYSKSWSDAQSEWWHIVYQAGHYVGPDPGPYGEIFKPEEDDDVSLFAVVKNNGAIEVFVRDENGKVWHTWQKTENSGWAGSEPGKNAAWYSLGTPGK
jgi:hypothetical protein